MSEADEPATRVHGLAGDVVDPDSLAAEHRPALPALLRFTEKV